MTLTMANIIFDNGCAVMAVTGKKFTGYSTSTLFTPLQNNCSVWARRSHLEKSALVSDELPTYL